MLERHVPSCGRAAETFEDVLIGFFELEGAQEVHAVRTLSASRFVVPTCRGAERDAERGAERGAARPYRCYGWPLVGTQSLPL